jgi:hypothetical protein
MISKSELELQGPVHHTLATPQDCDECARQLTAARRELGAFVMAVGKLHGEEAAAHAADYWVALAESSFELPSVNGFPSWRHITISAASHLAPKQFGYSQHGCSEEIGR